MWGKLRRMHSVLVEHLEPKLQKKTSQDAVVDLDQYNSLKSMLQNAAGDYRDDFEANISSFSIEDKQKADSLLKSAKWQLNVE